jgi:hypothetical protein
MSSPYDQVISGGLKLKKKGNSTMEKVAIIPAQKTSAELSLEETQKKKFSSLPDKELLKNRVSEFNKHLESLSEHHDIPKIGPG